MHNPERKPWEAQDPFVAGETFEATERLLAAFSHTSEIGFAVLDNQLRYQAINKCLVKINGLPGKAHLGVKVGEIFGELSKRVAEPHYRRVLRRGQASHFEVTHAVLPTRIESRYWGLNNCFPITDRTGRVRQVGMMVIEVTGQRKLEKFLRELEGKLRESKTKENFWFARELQDCIAQYHAALAVSLDVLVRNPAKSMEVLAESVEVLDQRIALMQILVSEAAMCFPIDQERYR